MQTDPDITEKTPLKARENSEAIEVEELGVIPKLHEAAKDGNFTELQNLLISVQYSPEILETYRGRTVLHYAAEFQKKKTATAMITCIVDCFYICMNPDVGSQLVNAKDSELGETALHKAAKRYNREGVIALLFRDADVNIRCKNGVQPISQIYKNVPTAIIAVFDHGIKLAEEDEDVDPLDEDLEVEVDFGAFVGLHSPQEDKNLLINETELITTVMRECSLKRSEVLLHPLVRLFLHYKWIKIKSLIWISMLLHITWSLCCSAFFVNMYWLNCPYNFTNTRLTQSGAAICNPGTSTLVLSIIVFIMCVILLSKEILEISQSPSFKYYLNQKENIAQWLLMLSVLLLSLGTMLRRYIFGNASHINAWEYPVAAIGTFVAFALILAQLGKHPQIGIYMEMLNTVSVDSFYFMMVYGCLLVAFWASFVILLPRRDEFQGYGFVKVVTIMTGEANYDSLFFGEQSAEQVPFRNWTQVLFLAVTLIMTIVLHNLLIGILVSDIQTLREQSQLSSIQTQLREINLMETFLLSRLSQKCIARRQWLEHFLVTQQSDDAQAKSDNEDFDESKGQKMTIHMHDEDIPLELRQRIREKVTQHLRTDSTPTTQNKIV